MNVTFLSKSLLGRLAGKVSLQIGIRPSTLLGRKVSWYDNLLLDSAILAEIQEGSSTSLSNEITRKYRRYGLV